MTELAGQRYFHIDYQGVLSTITFVDGTSDQFIKRGFDRSYRLGFSFRLNKNTVDNYGGIEQTASIIEDLERKLSVMVRFGELKIGFSDNNLFLAEIGGNGQLSITPDFGEDKKTGLLHLYNEDQDLGEFTLPLFYSPDPNLEPIELMMYFGYKYKKLEELLKRPDMENDEYYHELRKIVNPMVEIVG